MRIVLLSGPNLDLLGEREPAVYGTARLEDHVRTAEAAARAHGLELEHVQTNHEGELVEAVHAARATADALVVNAGALTHTSWSLHDALAAFDGVVVELHLSNPAAREPFRHTSVVAPVADGLVAGFGGLGYALAVDAAARLLATRTGTASAEQTEAEGIGTEGTGTEGTGTDPAGAPAPGTTKPTADAATDTARGAR